MTRTTYVKRYDTIAYGKPKQYQKAGKLINTGSNIGTTIVQFIYLRPESYGYHLALKKRK